MQVNRTPQRLSADAIVAVTVVVVSAAGRADKAAAVGIRVMRPVVGPQPEEPLSAAGK
jgi:hypothetical protein